MLRFDTDAAGTELTATQRVEPHRRLAGGGREPGPRGHHLGAGQLPGRQRLRRREHAAPRTTRPSYPDHGTGLFFVGVEATGNIYAYALDHVTGGFQRVATIASGNAGVMGLEFDRDVGNLWAYCDNTCGNRASVLRVGAAALPAPALLSAVPATLPDSNNEGIAIAPESECVAGRKSFFWSDDSNFGGHALRQGSIVCGALP